MTKITQQEREAHEEYNNKYFAKVSGHYPLAKSVFRPLHKKAAALLYPQAESVLDVATGLAIKPMPLLKPGRLSLE